MRLFYRYNKLILVLTFTILISSCYNYKVGIHPKEIKIKPDIIVIPFKVAPITIKSWGMGTFLLAGPLGTRAIDATTTKGEEEIAHILNEIHGNWDPSLVLAHECLSLIKENTVFQVGNINIVDSRELPDTETLRLKEPNLFTAKPFSGAASRSLAGEWMLAGGQWLKKAMNVRFSWI